MSALEPGNNIEPSTGTPFTASEFVRLLRKLLDHHHQFREKEEKALECLRNAKWHIADEEVRNEISWIEPKGKLRTPWTAAMEYFALRDTHIEEMLLREYLATFNVSGHLGLHPHAAIAGNMSVFARLMAL